MLPNMLSFIKRLFKRKTETAPMPVETHEDRVKAFNLRYPRVINGTTIKVLNNSFCSVKLGEHGTICDYMWDYPNWRYLVKFKSGLGWIWDYQIKPVISIKQK